MNPFTPRVKLDSINVVVTSKSVDETLVCDHSNESYFHELLLGFFTFCKMYDFLLNFQLSTLGSERVKKATGNIKIIVCYLYNEKKITNTK